MSIELRQSGFYEWHDHLKGLPGLGIDNKRIDECLAYYQQQGFRGLFGNPTFGFEQDHLDFLTHTKNVKWLWFWDIVLKNIDPIYELTELEHMGINPKRPGIDFSRLRSLRTVVNDWIKSDTGIAASTITEYNLWHYKPTSKSFAGLEIPTNVERLEFYWANPATLAGLPVLKQLKSLQFHRCRNLHDLSLLPQIAPNLQELLTTNSPKINATAGVVDHPKLQAALISGNFVVGTKRVFSG